MAQPLECGPFLLEEDPRVQTLSYWTLVVKPVVKVIMQTKASAIDGDLKEHINLLDDSEAPQVFPCCFLQSSG